MLVSDRIGVIKTVDTEIKQGEDIVEEKTEKKAYRNELKFTGLFAQRLYSWTLKGGIIENSGGFMVDYHLLPESLTLSMQGAGIEKFNLRAFLSYQTTYGLYLKVGYDDVLQKNELDSALFGAGIYLTNEDLKILMSRLPVN